MVTSMCLHLSAANTFTFMSLAHSFNFDSSSRSFKITKQQMIGCLEFCAQRRIQKDRFQDPLVTFDHEKRISYIRLLLMPLMPWGIILTELQENQAHPPEPVRLKHPVHATLPVQHSCQATAAGKLCKK